MKPISELTLDWGMTLELFDALDAVFGPPIAARPGVTIYRGGIKCPTTSNPKSSSRPKGLGAFGAFQSWGPQPLGIAGSEPARGTSLAPRAPSGSDMRS